EGAAQPPFADERHSGPARFAFDDFFGLPLGADEHDQPATRDDLRQVLVRAEQSADGFPEVDDVDEVALAVDVRPHLGVPPACSVPVMNTRFEKNFHVYESHDASFEDSAITQRLRMMS